MSFIVAIDGPAGSGKGTIAKRVAKRFGFINIDTGAMYRCIALKTIEKNVSLEQEDKIIEIAKECKIELKNKGTKQDTYLDGNDVSDRIRHKDVTDIVSQVSGIKEVRLILDSMQKAMGRENDIVMEGRDIGTNIFPNADIKIYLDADVEVRAKRRVKQNELKGINISYEDVLENLKMRDENDKSKDYGALAKAPDATYIDASKMTIEELDKKITLLIKEGQKKIKLNKKIYYVRPETWRKKFWRAIAKNLLHLMFKLLFFIKKENEENVPKEGSCIICANHVTALDPVAVVASTKRKLSFLAKEELFHNWFLRWVWHFMDIIPVKRGSGDIESMKRSIKVIKDGGMLGLFPEGTRKGLEKNAKIKNGAVYMAVRTGSRIVPIGIKGKQKIFTKMVLNYGEPIDYSKYKGQEKDKELLNKLSIELMDTIVMLTKE